MNHSPGCPECAGGDCDCIRYGSVLHYRWGGDGTFHSSAMYVRPVDFSLALLISLADTQFDRLDPIIVSQYIASWEPCGESCPFNAGHPYKEI